MFVYLLSLFVCVMGLQYLLCPRLGQNKSHVPRGLFSRGGKKIHSFEEKKTVLRASETNEAGPLSLALPELGPPSLAPCPLAPL